MGVGLRHGRACEGELLEIACPSNQVLRIRNAVLGKASSSSCRNSSRSQRRSAVDQQNDSASLCHSTRALRKVRERWDRIVKSCYRSGSSYPGSRATYYRIIFVLRHHKQNGANSNDGIECRINSAISCPAKRIQCFYYLFNAQLLSDILFSVIWRRCDLTCSSKSNTMTDRWYAHATMICTIRRVIAIRTPESKQKQSLLMATSWTPHCQQPATSIKLSA